MKPNFMYIFILLTINWIETVYPEYIPPGPKFKCPDKPQSIYPCKCDKETDSGLYLRCENSNLASISLALNNLVVSGNGGPLIEELTFSKCHFEHLYGSIFYKTKIRIVKFLDTPISTINEHVFQGTNVTLQELHIINSTFREFPKESLKILGNLTVLNIDGHKITNLDKDIFSESLLVGKLEKLHLVNGNLTEFPIESFQVLRKLKTLDLHGNNMVVLKKNQFKNLRDVEILDISFNKITKLDSSHVADLTKLGWCNVSHNALNELTRGTFARNSVLKVLNMSRNKIKRLDSNSFRGMRFLRRLYLSDNIISDVGRGTFGSVTRIGTIDLARNFIKKIDFNMFAQLNYVEILDVSENNVTEIQKQSFKDLYLTNINLSKNSISKIENYSFENCANITVLDLSYNLIKEFPKNTFDSGTYATELQLSYNLLTDMSKIPLHNMTGLKILNVSHNEITQIPKNTFPKLYELHTIDVAYNNLSEISNAVLQTLFSLRTLNLSNNFMEEIKSSTFGTLPTLLEMDLSFNRLTTIARGGLTKLASLRHLTLESNRLEKLFQIPISLNHLNLRNNWLSNIPDLTWPTMNALLSLDLSGNRLMNSLAGETFRGLITLQSLNLNYNGISRIPWESLSVLSTLQYLYLENNNLTELTRGAFGKLPVVFEVNLFNNHIGNISQLAFDGLLQLLKLNLSSNVIRHIPNEAFFGLVSLRTLDLSNNFLEKLDNKTHGLLDDCLSLEKINLSHNKISFVTKKTFPSNPYIPYRLNEIDLSYNIMPVLTYDITFGTKKLKLLNVSNNYITDIRKYILGNLTSLEILDISNNNLGDLKAHDENKLILPENITKLYLQNNSLTNLPIDSLLNTTKLNLLDIRNNQLEIFNPKLMEKIRTGLNVYMEDNPLNCDCFIRPLKHYLYTVIDPSEYYQNILCNSPKLIEGQYLRDVDDDHLNCLEKLNLTKIEIIMNDLEILPDIRFRDVSYARGNLSIQWYVTAITKDIGDFYVNIRDSKNNILIEEQLQYNKRTIGIPGTLIPSTVGPIHDDDDKQLQLCILAKNSRGIIGNWFESQCLDLPKNFDKIKRQYTVKNNEIYTITSLNTRKKIRNIFGKSNAIRPTNGCDNIIKFLLFIVINYYIKKQFFK